MGVFCYKKIDPGVHLYKQFTTLKGERGLSDFDISRQTTIPQKYVSALLSGAYAHLPPTRAHRIAYVRELSTALDLDPKTAVKQFCREGGLVNVRTLHPHTGIRFSRFASVSMLVRNIALGLAAILFLAYLGWQVRGVLEPPKLVVYAPFDGDTSNDQIITVQGETNPETHLTINGQAVAVNGSGSFETKIDAAEGLNTITVSATKKHGKTTTITRHVVVRPKLTQATSQDKP